MKPYLCVLCLLNAQAAETSKTIIELQQFRQSASMEICSSSGRKGAGTLINLNPAINAWYLLKVAWAGLPEASYHLENASPRTKTLTLDQGHASELVIVEGKHRYYCDLFGSATVLENAKASSRIYEPLCDGRIYLRNPATGHRTNLEAATEFLRDHVWGAEKIISLGHILLGDAHREMGEVAAGEGSQTHKADEPVPALIDPEYAAEVVASNNLGISLDGPQRNGMTPGAW